MILTKISIIRSYDIFLHAFVCLDLFVDRICQYKDTFQTAASMSNLARDLRDAPNKQRQMVPCLLNIYEPIPRMCRVYGNLHAIWEMKDMLEKPLNNLVKFHQMLESQAPIKAYRLLDSIFMHQRTRGHIRTHQI